MYTGARTMYGTPIPSYAMGGQVAQPMPMQQGQGQPTQLQLDPNALSLDFNSLISSEPGAADMVNTAAQSLGWTPEQAAQVGQIVILAMQRPNLWPQLRQYAIQSLGLTEDDLPEGFSPGFLMALAMLCNQIAGSLQPPPSAPMQGIPQTPMQSGMATGGLVNWATQGAPTYAAGGKITGPGSGTSDSILGVNTSTDTPVAVSNGEFIIPAHVVRAKGTEFFDSLIKKYSMPQE